MQLVFSFVLALVSAACINAQADSDNSVRSLGRKKGVYFPDEGHNHYQKPLYDKKGDPVVLKEQPTYLRIHSSHHKTDDGWYPQKGHDDKYWGHYHNW